MMTVPCRWGTIYSHGGELLALELDRHPKIAKQVAAIPGVTLHQDGDDEKTFLFSVSMFDQVALLVQPKRVRRLGEEHKAKLLEAGQRFRFKGRFWRPVPASAKPLGPPRVTRKSPKPISPRIRCRLLGLNPARDGGREGEGLLPSSAASAPSLGASAGLGRGRPGR
jgi:hypothetical protein